MERITLFVEILLPLPIPGSFTYRVPFDLNREMEIGKRVVVQFGRQKIYTGLVKEIHQIAPTKYTPKYILSILDPSPIVNKLQLKFWDWIADYYMCHPGEVMNVALPSALKLASETRIVQNPDFDGDTSNLNEKEYLIAEAIDIQKVLTLTEVSRIVEFKKVIPLIKNLIEKKVVLTEEEVKDRYRPKVETFVSLKAEYRSDEKLREIFDVLEKRAFKQLELLMTYIRLVKDFKNENAGIKKADLLK